MKNFGLTQEEMIKTAAEAALELQKASEESSAFIQQAAVNPDQIKDNAQKMGLLGWALTLYTLNWFRKLIF